jgi:hypothetical protein
MSLLKKLFSKSESNDVYPIVPEGMNGVFMKGIGMH